MTKATSAGVMAPARNSHRVATLDRAGASVSGLSTWLFKVGRTSERIQDREREKRDAENEDVFSVRHSELGVITESSQFAGLAKGQPFCCAVVLCHNPQFATGHWNNR